MRHFRLKANRGSLAGGAICITAFCLVQPAWGLDVAAAEQAIKDNNCHKCHTVDRKKDGPAYRDVAAKFRQEADSEEKVIHHITAGELVKFPDGHKERHKKIKLSSQDEVINVARWILSLEGGSKQ